MKSTEQTELFRHSAPFLAKAYREAAAAARIDPHWSPDDGERRAQHYEAEAVKLEHLA